MAAQTPVQTKFLILRRLAEVWLDEYKKFFYEVAPDAKTLDMGDLSEQLANKKRLNCKPFKYFITDVVIDMHPPTLKNRAEGSMKTLYDNLCVDSYNEKTGPAKLFSCHHQGGNQAVSLSEIGEIRLHITSCLENSPGTSQVSMAQCNGSQKQMWDHKKGEGWQVIHKVTHQCLTQHETTIKLADCIDESKKESKPQKWLFDKYYDPPQ